MKEQIDTLEHAYFFSQKYNYFLAYNVANQKHTELLNCLHKLLMSVKQTPLLMNFKVIAINQYIAV